MGAKVSVFERLSWITEKMGAWRGNKVQRFVVTRELLTCLSLTFSKVGGSEASSNRKRLRLRA